MMDNYALRQMLLAIDGKAWDRTIVTRPEDEERIRHAVDEVIPGVRIIVSSFVEEGEVLLINDEALDLINATPSWEWGPAERQTVKRGMFKITDIAV